MIRLAAAAAFVLAVAGCTSSGGGTTPPSSTPHSAPPSSMGGTGAGQAGELAAKVRAAVADLKSARVDIDAGLLGGTATGTVSFAHGTTTASDVVLDQSGQRVRVVTIDGTCYAQLPAGQSTSGKPWMTVTSGSSNEFVRGLAGTLSLVKAGTSLDSLAALSTATTSVRSSGDNSYDLIVDPTKLTGDLAAAVGMTGAKSLPVELGLDTKNRPVHVRLDVPLGGQSLPLTIDVSDFDAPVHIAAPPASRVGTG